MRTRAAYGLLALVGCLSPECASIWLDAPDTMSVAARLPVTVRAHAGGSSSCWSDTYDAKVTAAESRNPAIVRVEVDDGRALVIGVSPGRARVRFKVWVDKKLSEEWIDREIVVLELEKVKMSVVGRTECLYVFPLLARGS